MQERKSSVLVKVLDLTPLLNEALEKAKASDATVFKMTANHRVGIVETKKGTFILIDEGVGSKKPIEKDTDPLKLGLYAYTKNAEGKEFMPLIPLYTVTLNANVIGQLPVASTENLATFIRSFGRRLEYNFATWNDVLTKAGLKEVAACT